MTEDAAPRPAAHGGRGHLPAWNCGAPSRMTGDGRCRSGSGTEGHACHTGPMPTRIHTP